MRVLVSIHDVAPPFAAEVESLWQLCQEYDVQAGLLVVPDWHGGAPLREAPTFTAWVRARAAEGADILLHGERHDEVNLPRSPMDHMRAVGRTDGEGEFLTLGTREALLRMQRGVRTLTNHGMPPIGFVPPAWLARPGLARVVRLAGLLVTEDAARVWLPRRGLAITSPVVRWSARTTWRAGLSRVVARTRSAWESRSGLVRVALHPADLRHPWTMDSLRRTLDRECTRRRPVTYSELAVQDDVGYAA